MNNDLIENASMFKLSYGLFVLTARDGEKDNGCIINAVSQITDNPKQITITVNKNNLTHDMIVKTGCFNISVLTQEVPFKIFEKFGFKSGKDTNKFETCKSPIRSENGVYYLPKHTNAFISGKVISTVNCGTHTLFISEVTEAKVLSDVPSVTYDYYFKHIKPETKVNKSSGKVWVCTICGYVYDEEKEGVPFEELPDDWTCLLCNHPKSDFVLQE